MSDYPKAIKTQLNYWVNQQPVELWTLAGYPGVWVDGDGDGLPAELPSGAVWHFRQCPGIEAEIRKLLGG